MSLYSKIQKAAIFAMLTIIGTGCSVFGVHDYESPGYKVIQQDGDKEIRYYKPFIVAKTTVKGDFKEAQSSAFRILADYIFGNNIKKQKIAMTGPLVQKKDAQNEKIAMTGPVVQSGSGDEWVMTFMMPSTYAMEELPTPKDKRVSFEKIPARYVAIIRYGWYGSLERNQDKAKELLDWLAKNKDFKVVSPPMYAGYDPPWTIPFFRHNEMMVELQKN
ncbi:SOUL family heme-binding protein [Desulfoferula mesophila]|uniref:SOUL heme-binding protein n=1 Tax=Desulfoferula mesophila TaxID=3058419 RepID=A0AAU9EMB4_9BACT|nr:hypothetical protein FAK_02160 [Desulfoferula mesophilus]